MRYRLFTLFLILILFCVGAESFTVRGKITTIDSTAVQYASVKFVLSNDTSIVFSAVTDTLGEYTIILTRVSEPEQTIQSFTLYQNYPNPFSEQTAIPYSLKGNSQVNVTIYDILGKKVKSFDQSYQPSGTYSIEWDGTDEEGRKVAYGIYFYRIISKQGTQTKKMVYVNPNDLRQYLSYRRFESRNSINTLANTYTLNIENTDSTKPKIESTKVDNVIIHGDTVINIQVVEASKWELLGLKEEDIISIAVHPTNENIIYAGSSYDFSAGHMGKLFKSVDSGKTWDTLIVGQPLFFFLDIVIDPFNPETLYTIPLPILKSTNGGETWFEIFNEVDWETRVSSIALDPNNSLIIYAGLGGFQGGGLIKSTDGGESWIVLSRGDTLTGGVVSIAIDPNNSNIVYAGTAGAGRLWKTTDGGDTWILTGLGTTNQMINDILIHPTDSRIVIACISGIGIWKSEDTGNTWIQYNDGLTDSIKNAMKIIMKKEGIESFLIYSTPDNPPYGIWDNGGVYWRFGENNPWLKIGIDNLRSYYYSDIKLSKNENVIYFGSKGIFWYKLK